MIHQGVCSVPLFLSETHAHPPTALLSLVWISTTRMEAVVLFADQLAFL